LATGQTAPATRIHVAHGGYGYGSRGLCPTHPINGRVRPAVQHARERDRVRPAENYPPYDIERTSENGYRITLAVAGFAPEELSITAQPNQLVVAGKKAGEDSGEYLYRGIAGRAFQRQFNLADYVKVVGASLKDGMLSIELVREVPEALKPRRIEIANGNQPQIESAAAA
jgi:molecular chaperone IbpA